MNKILFCNIGWMENYDGIEGDSIEGGGEYNRDNIGHEVCNFSNINGNIYGYVRPSGSADSQIHIERIGADKNADSISSVTVVWTATSNSKGTVVIGWYKNAEVYRFKQELENITKKQEDNNISHYRIRARAEDVTLLPIAKRTLSVPRAQKVKGGMGQSNIWYADDLESPEVSDFVQNVMELIDKGLNEELPDIESLVVLGIEGNPKFVVHLQRERNQKLVQAKKQDVLDSTGQLSCEVCNFDFKSQFGELGEGFCEVHHLIPLSRVDGEVETKLEDLAIVCSNCHRMLHRRDPMLTLSELKETINS